MEFFTRPRQDFTLSRIADALRFLECSSNFYPSMCVSREKKNIIVIRIEVVGDIKDMKELAERTIDILIKVGHFDKNDFTFIEPPSEAAVPEVD